MSNVLIIKQNWWQKNWKWFLPTSVLLLLLGFVLVLSIAGNATDIVQAYNDETLYTKAIEKVKLNKRVIEVLGEIKPIDKLAILEGNTKYSNNNNSVEISIRIIGSKEKGKMDVIADKIDKEWKYKKITIRIKNPKEKIEILK
ncbi:hypothetical protein FIA58_000655 [Flavobacterium jejuense]|uniref:Cytochrome oxidase complex assembly protein 1 n=1 Tax=Flavobacterium jejuense TaxID=1544455 RepID=A0ABX0IK18_9FLAO|nr:cytochrome c oxidase assembly factor Coa1 family protein [Flavobacterium jejuense]NHN24172.1 hypothetical protein [Flavobacterium jejuense]